MNRVHRLLAASAALLLPALALAGPASSATLVAEDLAPSLGLTDVSSTQGQNCVLDLNGDAIRDLVLSRHGAPWYVMQGATSGAFTKTGETSARDRHGCASGDFGGVAADGTYTGPDGLSDYFITVGACKGQCTKPYPNELWLQRADHTFVDAAAAFGVADEHGRGREPMSLDFDNDGLMDLFVGNEESQVYFSANRLYRNASGRFVEVTGTPLTAEIGSLCSAHGDIDGDGWKDIVNCSTTLISAYQNTGGTGFTDVSASLGLPTGAPKDLELADLNADGRPDLVVVKMTSLQVRLNRGGSFGTVDFTLKIGQGRNAAVGDANGDARPDIYLVQGKNSAYQDLLLLNGGLSAVTGKWQFVSATLPQTTVGDGDTAVALTNWQGSGRDAFLVNNGKWTAKGPRQLLFMMAR